MLPDPVSNPGPLTYESGALPIALRSPATLALETCECKHCTIFPFSFFSLNTFFQNIYLQNLSLKCLNDVWSICFGEI